MSSATLLSPTEASTDNRRWIALVVLCVGVLMIILDSTIVNVALPSIQDDLGFSQSSLAWVVNAYLIAFGGLLLLAGRLGDLIGRKRVFMAGLAVFTVASLLCGVAQSQELLIAARFVQGVGGALTSAVILGMIVTMFPEPREQTKAIGVYSFVAAAGASIGLLAGGVLTQAINWHWIFFVNIPIGVATAVLARRLVDDDEGIGVSAGADLAGAVLIVSALMLGVYTIVETGEQGWASAHTLGFGGLSLALLAGFLVRQTRAANPLMALRIFRSRNVTGANAVGALMVAGMFGMFFLGALYMERVLGYDAIEIGLAFLPVALLIGLLSLRFADQLILRFGGRAVLHSRARADRAGPGLVRARPGGRRLRGRSAARDARARPGRRPHLPGADDAGDVRRHRERRRAGLRADQHHRSGRRRPGPGRGRGAGHRAHRGPARRGRLARRGAGRRLSARLRGRCRAAGGGDRRGARGAAARGSGCGRVGARRGARARALGGRIESLGRMPDTVSIAPALQVRDLVKRYPTGTEALKGVSLEIREGEFFGLLGPNGAGKSTLIHCATGLARPTEGDIRAFGHDAVENYGEARMAVGLAAQELNLDWFLTVAEQLDYHAGYFGMPRRERRERADELLEAFSLTDKRDERTRTLSGGMKRRLVLARALMHRPRLLILDEPTAGVDVELRLELWQYVKRINSEGTTILLTTHYLEEAEQLCDHIAFINDGRIVASGTSAELSARFGVASLEDAYLELVGRGELSRARIGEAAP